MIIIDMFTYFMDKNVYIILWGIVNIFQLVNPI